jgi:hypothetical protein
MTLEEHLDYCRFCNEDELCREGARLATRERLEREAIENAEYYSGDLEF